MTFTNYNPTSPTNGLGNVVPALLAGGSSTTSGIVLEGSVTLRTSADEAVHFYDGSIPSLGIGAGLVLTSGYIPGAVNDIGWDGWDNSGVTGFSNGDADIDAVVNKVFQTQSYDATTLEFSFSTTDPNATSISFDVVFGSEEFPEWVDLFVDCGIVMVNGVNYALFNHDPMHPLSVISSNLAAGYFQDNAGPPPPLAIQYDGVSQVLKIVAPIISGQVNHIKIGIADTGDHILDSGMFIANLSAGNIPGSGVVSTAGGCTAGNDVVTGSIKDEYFDLQAGNDTVYAGAGDDIVVGGDGSDVIYGGTGADKMEGDAGDDWIDGGADSDTVVFAGNMPDYDVIFDGVSTQLTAKASTASTEGTDHLVNVEFVQFKNGLYALSGSLLTPADPGTPPPGNAPGLAAISGVGAVGGTLTAIVSDPDGIQGAITYQWYAGATPINGATGSTLAVSSGLVGSDISFTADYVDGKTQQSVSLASAPKTIVAGNDGDFTIELIQLSAPLGATVKNPLTTLVDGLVQLGVSPNEASIAVKNVLSVDPTVDLRTYDSWAALTADPTDSTALHVEILAVQVAVITSAGGDQTGIALAQAIAAAYQDNKKIALTDLAFIQGFVGEADPNGVVQEIHDRNSNLAGAKNLAFIESEWADFQSGLPFPVSNTVGDLTVHINQAPVGVATAELSTQEGAELPISVAELLAGFSDPDGDALTVTGLALDQGGTIAANAGGGWTFTPKAGFSGPVELTYSIDDGKGASVSATAMLIVSAVDHPATGVLTVDGVGQEGATLFATLAASDLDGGIIGTTYRWQELIGGNWANLAGQTDATLAIPSDQSYVGKTVRVVATTTDAHGAKTEFLVNGLPIANVNDPHTGTVTISGTAEQGQTLTAAHTLADADGMGTISYQWMAGGVAIGSATGSAYTLTQAEVDKAISVTASFSDAFGTIESETSAATAPVAALPPTGLNLVGTSGNDVLTGDAGNDTLSGLGGSDTLNGNAGNDVLNGGAGTDLLDGGEGSDLYLVSLSTEHSAAEFKDTGVTGSDEVRFAATKSSTLTLYSGDTGIERVAIGTGSGASADSSGTTALNVNASAVVNGLMIIGNSGKNSLTGTAMNDTLDGGGGADVLVGGSGDDVLKGGTGNDTLTGGAGADYFVFDTAFGSTNVDTVADFFSGSDKLQFSVAVFTALGPTFTADQFWAAAGATSGHDPDDRIIYNSKTGALYYDADGSGAGAAVQVTVVGTKTHPALEWGDIQPIS